MRTIKSINELNIPPNYQAYLSAYLRNIKDIPYISRVILFGSCARENVRKYSDIDIFVTVNRDISLAEEFLISCDSLPEYEMDTHISTDILVQTETKFDNFSDSFGMVQKQVIKDGVDLSGLL
ncbi:MAG: nucleotidyltransferase domain-containing protein [Turicibacter sp.]|nr:nucleotidyltransferase domain-containing protein [Turicibacter sp.]